MLIILRCWSLIWPKLKRALPVRQSSFTRTLYENEKITFLLLQCKCTLLPCVVKIIVVKSTDYEVSLLNFDVWHIIPPSNLKICRYLMFEIHVPKLREDVYVECN